MLKTTCSKPLTATHFSPSVQSTYTEATATVHQNPSEMCNARYASRLDRRVLSHHHPWLRVTQQPFRQVRCASVEPCTNIAPHTPSHHLCRHPTQTGLSRGTTDRQLTQPCHRDSVCASCPSLNLSHLQPIPLTHPAQPPVPCTKAAPASKYQQPE